VRAYIALRKNEAWGADDAEVRTFRLRGWRTGRGASPALPPFEGLRTGCTLSAGREGLWTMGGGAARRDEVAGGAQGRTAVRAYIALRKDEAWGRMTPR
jgi:hypothetical protein